MKLEVYTDGSATTKNKPGGYGWVIVKDGEKLSEGSGHMENATNNDAELEAAIQGLANAFKYIVQNRIDNTAAVVLPIPHVTLCSDSQLVLGWTEGTWKFKQLDKLAQYHKLRALVERMDVKTRWVKGHAGDVHNERCDELANMARKGIQEVAEREEAKAKGETLIGTKKVGVIPIWFGKTLKIVDLEKNCIEDYNREIHGPRGSALEIRPEKSR